MSDEAEDGGEGKGKRNVLHRLAARLQNPRELGGDAMEIVGAMLESSDRVKTEAVRLIAREVRTYLDELKLKEDLRALLTGHSLEVKMSLSLKPLAPEAPSADPKDGGDLA